MVSFFLRMKEIKAAIFIVYDEGGRKHQHPFSVGQKNRTNA